MADTAKWVRVRLTSPPSADGPSLTDGELILRADMIEYEADAVVFLVGSEEVFRLDRRYHQTHAWFVDRPTFADWLRQRRAKHPNQRRPWSDDELARLRSEARTSLSHADWERIAKEHGRTVLAVKTRAALIAREEA